MQIRFSRAEYWLLENVVDSVCPLVFVRDRDFSEVLYKKGHGLDRPALVEVLHELFLSGRIAATWQFNDATFNPTIDQIENALNGAKPGADEPCLCYELTEKGGADWELFAQPNWHRYISYEQGELAGMQREQVEEYLRGLHFEHSFEVQTGTERWDVLQPWKATYWKTLPFGHRVRFEVVDYFPEVSQYEHNKLRVCQHRRLRRWYDWRTW